jgi:3'(2'), 5'-bisphosphate nucleotidase
MKTLILSQLLDLAKTAALEGGKAILKIYETADFGVEAKSDNSPLTLADKAAHQAIVRYLETSGLPILSEEGKNVPYEERSQWEYFWLVDPLDGTKEFIKRNGEFTVNIALIHKGRAIAGVVYVPVLGKMYYALQGQGAFRQIDNQIESLHTQAKHQAGATNLKIVASRSHSNQETEDFIAQYPDAELVSMGSSLKFILVAEGAANVYPRIAPTMEWDTAAAQIVVEEAGGKVMQFAENQPVVYNKENLLNPYFVVYDC